MSSVVCECGAHPVVEDGSKTDGVVRETYRCERCGGRGTLVEDMRTTTTGTRLSGCLTRVSSLDG